MDYIIHDITTYLIVLFFYVDSTFYTVIRYFPTLLDLVYVTTDRIIVIYKNRILYIGIGTIVFGSTDPVYYSWLENFMDRILQYDLYVINSCGWS